MENNRLAEAGSRRARFLWLRSFASDSSRACGK